MASSGASGPRLRTSMANVDDDDEDEKVEMEAEEGAPKMESRGGIGSGTIPVPIPGAEFARAASRSSQYAGGTGRKVGG